jgi:hypothetical protein
MNVLSGREWFVGGNYRSAAVALAGHKCSPGRGSPATMLAGQRLASDRGRGGLGGGCA